MQFKIIADENVNLHIVNALKNEAFDIISVLKEISVIFLRYDSKDLIKITDTLIKVINDYGASLYRKFVVITINKIRIREI